MNRHKFKIYDKSINQNIFVWIWVDKCAITV